jgi:hypothetical protein
VIYRIWLARIIIVRGFLYLSQIFRIEETPALLNLSVTGLWLVARINLALTIGA